jgi:hypothetical protein
VPIDFGVKYRSTFVKNNGGDNTNSKNVSQVQMGLSSLHYRQLHMDAVALTNGFASIFSCPFLLTRPTVS